MKLQFNLTPAQQRLLHFCVVGGTAALVHESIVIICVEWFNLFALQANVVGFICAFAVSYLGHSRFTFAHSQVHMTTLSHTYTATTPVVHRTAFPRFLAVALASFTLNQLLFAALLNWTALSYGVALFIVLLSVAVLTFVLSKLWVFKPHHSISK